MTAASMQEEVKASKLVYDFCAAHGICTLCKRHYAENGRMCAKCRNLNKRAQKNIRDRKKEGR